MPSAQQRLRSAALCMFQAPAGLHTSAPTIKGYVFTRDGATVVTVIMHFNKTYAVMQCEYKVMFAKMRQNA